MPHVFVYDHLSPRRMEDCVGDVEMVSAMILRNHRVVFTGMNPRFGYTGTADLTHDEYHDDANVMGLMYDVSEDQLVLLDAIKGRDGYIRGLQEVEYPSGETAPAWVYTKTRDEGAEIPPSASYLKHHQDLAFQAYIDFKKGQGGEDGEEMGVALDPESLLSPLPWVVSQGGRRGSSGGSIRGSSRSSSRGERG